MMMDTRVYVVEYLIDELVITAHFKGVESVVCNVALTDWPKENPPGRPWQSQQYGLLVAHAILNYHFTALRGTSEAQLLAVAWAEQFAETLLKTSPEEDFRISDMLINEFIVNCCLDDLGVARSITRRAANAASFVN